MPGGGDLPRGRAARQVGALREDQLRLRRRDGDGEQARRRVRHRAQRPEPTPRVEARSEPSGKHGRIRLWILMPDDVHELSALYALDVLDDEERATFERHLAECERCRAELAGLRDAAGSLAFAVEGPAPPPEL